MGDQQRAFPNAPFPAPPPFWKHFTAQNLAKLKTIQDADDDGKHRIYKANPELQYLTPPPPPTSVYSIFGEEHTLSSMLPSLGNIQLFPETSASGGPINHAYYLTKITKSLLLNFLELTTILSSNPSLSIPKLEDIKQLFRNAHHLINIYRPHQARETLIMMMEDQLEDGRKEIEECDRVKQKVETMLRRIEANGAEISQMKGSRDRITASKMADTSDAKRLWQMIDALDGD